MALEEWPSAEVLEKARFCLITGIAPSEYDRLTDEEIAAFTEVHNDLRSPPA